MTASPTTAGEFTTATRTTVASLPLGLGLLTSTLILRAGLRRPTRSG